MKKALRVFAWPRVLWYCGGCGWVIKWLPGCDRVLLTLDVYIRPDKHSRVATPVLCKDHQPSPSQFTLASDEMKHLLKQLCEQSSSWCVCVPKITSCSRAPCDSTMLALVNANLSPYDILSEPSFSSILWRTSLEAFGVVSVGHCNGQCTIRLMMRKWRSSIPCIQAFLHQFIKTSDMHSLKSLFACPGAFYKQSVSNEIETCRGLLPLMSLVSSHA